MQISIVAIKAFCFISKCCDNEIIAAIVVVITTGHPFDVAHDRDAAFRRALGKRAVSVVAIEFTGMALFINGFVADKDIEPPIAVEIEPGRSLSGVKAQQASLLGNVFKCSITPIAPISPPVKRLRKRWLARANSSNLVE